MNPSHSLVWNKQTNNFPCNVNIHSNRPHSVRPTNIHAPLCWLTTLKLSFSLSLQQSVSFFFFFSFSFFSIRTPLMLVGQASHGDPSCTCCCSYGDTFHFLRPHRQSHSGVWSKPICSWLLIAYIYNVNVPILFFLMFQCQSFSMCLAWASWFLGFFWKPFFLFIYLFLCYLLIATFKLLVLLSSL